MKNSDNIEKLFKETFDHFEADVNPRIWANVQSGINAVSGSTAVASKFAIGKIVVGAVSVALISGSIWYFSSSDDKIKSSQEKNKLTENIIKEKSAPAITSEQQLPDRVSNTNTNRQMPPAARTLNQQSSYSAERTQIIGGSNDNVVSSEESVSDNYTNASSQPPHKYGNATQGDGGMIRGNQGAYIASSNGNSSGSSADTEEMDPDAPTAIIFVNSSSGDAPLTVDFISQGVASSLNWDFGDGSTSRESAPSHTFDKPGNYVVKLTAKNSSGIASDKVSIEVRAVSSITNIPNIFTPNGDGENDNFFFEMKNIVSVGVAIYSQKEGKQIYTWNSIDGKWNGKLMNGLYAPEGVYLYSIQANGTDGIVHSKKGFITLSTKR